MLVQYLSSRMVNCGCVVFEKVYEQAIWRRSPFFRARIWGTAIAQLLCQLLLNTNIWYQCRARLGLRSWNMEGLQSGDRGQRCVICCLFGENWNTMMWPTVVRWFPRDRQNGQYTKSKTKKLIHDTCTAPANLWVGIEYYYWRRWCCCT